VGTRSRYFNIGCHATVLSEISLCYCTRTSEFITDNPSHSALRIGYKVKYIEGTVNTKFLGLQFDNHLNWKSHTEPMIPKLSGACFAVTSMVHISSINTLKSVY
jgi:hypothetical protein